MTEIEYAMAQAKVEILRAKIANSDLTIALSHVRLASVYGTPSDLAQAEAQDARARFALHSANAEMWLASV